MAGILTYSPHITIRAITHAAPTLNGRRRIIRPTARLFEVDRQPIRAVRHAIEELIILCSAHSVNRDVKVLGVAHIVYYYSLLGESGTRRNGKGSTSDVVQVSQ
jgi:hypothetical protein